MNITDIKKLFLEGFNLNYNELINHQIEIISTTYPMLDFKGGYANAIFNTIFYHDGQYDLYTIYKYDAKNSFKSMTNVDVKMQLNMLEIQFDNKQKEFEKAYLLVDKCNLEYQLNSNTVQRTIVKI